MPNATAKLSTADIKRRDALEAVCRYGSHSIERRCGLWSGYQALRREGKVTLTAIGGSRWQVQLVGTLRKAYLDGEDMTPYARGEAAP